MRHDYFGDEIAASYDESMDVRFSADHLALESTFLAQLAGPGGRALELAIGTGRAALPLAARGIDVAGIDLSDAMVAELRSKPGGADLDVVIGDYTAPASTASSTSSTWCSTPSAMSPARTPRWRRSRTPHGTCDRAVAS